MARDMSSEAFRVEALSTQSLINTHDEVDIKDTRRWVINPCESRGQNACLPSNSALNAN